MTGTIQIFCPPMPVFSTNNPRVHVTTDLPCKFTIQMEDGTKYAGIITYLPCDIHFIKAGLWRVDEAPATGILDNGWQIGLTLNKEDVTYDGLGKRTAQEVEGAGTIWLGNDILATLDIVSPAVESHRGKIGEFIVDACTETGTVEFV